MKMITPDITRRTVARDTAQTTHRARVGMIGLAAILLLIGLAAAFVATVSREQPAAIAGAANADVVANMVASNAADPAQAGEPLAQLGVAPSAAGDFPGNQSDQHAARAKRP